MKARVSLLTEDGMPICDYTFDSCKPFSVKRPAEHPLRGGKVDGDPDRSYEFFGFTYQPHVRVEKSTAPVVSGYGPDSWDRGGVSQIRGFNTETGGSE